MKTFAELAASDRPLSIDTRTLQPGDFFVALDGAKQKGHSYLPEAFKRGAAGALVASVYQSEVQSDKTIFHDNPSKAMAELGHARRDRFNHPLIGIVGSVGKTSTKEFLAFLLARKFPVLSTAGNLNNHLGLPLMLSRLNAKHEAAVLELGSDHVGDLSALVKIAEPTHAILTPIAPEHLAGFGSLSGVYDGELEILESKKLKILVTVEGDAELDRRLAKSKIKVIRVGFSDQADVRIQNVKLEGVETHFTIEGQKVTLPFPAAFMSLNAGLAAAMAIELGLNWNDLAGDWTPQMPGGRFQVHSVTRDLTVIDDTYNSSPLAFTAAIETFDKMHTGRKWLVFSDMLELGAESAKWHAEIGRAIGASGIANAWAFGAESKLTVEIARSARNQLAARHFESCESLCAALAEEWKPGDWILLKGSRGMRVERVLEFLKSRV